MASAQLGFGIFVIHKAEMFPWDKCLRFAMDRLNHIRVSNVHDATLWEERPLDWIHQHFSYVPPPPPVTQKRQRTNTSDTTGPMPSRMQPDEIQEVEFAGPDVVYVLGGHAGKPVSKGNYILGEILT
ncbi:hypothetical protein E4U39_004221 [Claviceps sp. Clav50 group G5]|nr:hypothetical protein E4U39_004221 [Claviceps sp. Clav50 group G5]